MYIEKRDKASCDYCGNGGDRTFVKTVNDTNRDICRVCVQEAYKLFNEKSFINRTATMFSNIAKRLLDNDTKTLIRAGFLSNDLLLTERGEEALLSVMLQSNLPIMVKEAAEEIAEQEAASKK